MVSGLFSQVNRLPVVAVLDFEGRGISQQEAYTLTDRLISELGDTKAVILVERKQLDKILEEQGLQQSGCTTNDCVAKVGELLGVQYMISGSINRIGNVFTIDAKMFSVETGAAIRTVKKTYRGEIDGLILIIESLAWEIVGLDRARKITTAVLDFEGRGISQMEAATLTDRFRSALGQTEAVKLVARQEMNEVLDEQGYQRSAECTSVECAAEVGALLGVEQIVNGAVGKVGKSFTIDAQLVSVGTGATLKTVSKTYRGEVDGLITEIELLAWEIVEREPPAALIARQQRMSQTLVAGPAPKQKSRFGAAVRSLFIPGLGQFYSQRKLWGWVWLTTEVAVGGLIYINYTQYQSSLDEYNQYHALYLNETNTLKIQEYKQQARHSHQTMDSANEMMKNLALAGGALWLGNVVHAFLTGPKREPSLGLERSAQMQVAYDPMSGAPQMRWSFTLD